jgi:hypothetical protein
MIEVFIDLLLRWCRLSQVEFKANRAANLPAAGCFGRKPLAGAVESPPARLAPA